MAIINTFAGYMKLSLKKSRACRYILQSRHWSSVDDFHQMQRKAHQDVKLIHQVLDSENHQRQLQALREATKKEDLWSKPKEAAVLVQQLSVLEKREKLAAQLQLALHDASEMYGMWL